MAEVIYRNVVTNFNYTMKALVFIEKIILNKLNIYKKKLFVKFEKDLKTVIKLSFDLQFVN